VMTLFRCCPVAIERPANRFVVSCNSWRTKEVIVRLTICSSPSLLR
jgi:hypothetical protein